MGCRYDGFEQSLQSAAANIAQGEGDLEKSTATSRAAATAEAALRSGGGKLRDTFKLVRPFMCTTNMTVCSPRGRMTTCKERFQSTHFHASHDLEMAGDRTTC